MSISIFQSGLRASIASSSTSHLLPLASTSTSTSQSHAFHTSPTPTAASRRKIIARQKKSKVLALRAERSRLDVNELIDPVLGDVRPDRKNAGGFMSRMLGGKERNEQEEQGGKYEKSLLKKVILDRESIWYSQPPAYSQPPTSEIDINATNFPPPPSQQPSHFSQHLTSPSDRSLLFRDLPNMAEAYTPARRNGLRPEEINERDAEEIRGVIAEERRKSEMVGRVVDLRNADARGVRTANIRRIVEVFGGDLDETKPLAHTNSGPASAQPNPQPQPERLNTSHPTVISAILTHRIHLLSAHLSSNPRDTHNRKALRELVHKRAKVLRYYKRRVGRKGGEGEEAYLGLLEKLGVDRRGVEGELIVR